MKLDSENDRQMLLDIIGSSAIQGKAVFQVADLVRRIQVAGIEVPPASSIDRIGATHVSSGPTD
jgi:hypothetical protein